MNLIDAIEKLQQKPEPTRYKIMILGVVLIMAFIIGLYLTIPSREKLEAVDIAGPFKLLWQNIKTIIPTE